MMAHPDEVFHKIESLDAVERKEYEELKYYHSEEGRRRRERTVFLGYCVVGILALLLVFGFLNFEELRYLFR